jgi:AP-2 complex subunit mu-1
VLKCDVAGKVLVRALLSGMPELRLGLSDTPEDITFHQCVNLPAWETHKVVLFVPPDGESELMR